MSGEERAVEKVPQGSDTHDIEQPPQRSDSHDSDSKLDIESGDDTPRSEEWEDDSKRDSKAAALSDEIQKIRSERSSPREEATEHTPLMGAQPSMKKHSSMHSMRKRVIYADMSPRVISTRSTVASLFLGEGTSIEAMVFAIGAKNAVSTGVLWVLWVIGALVGLLVVARALPLGLVWTSLLMLPLPLVMTLLLSTDLVAEIFSSMDVWIIFILQFALFMDGLYYCKQDMRSLYWYCYLPTMLAAGLVDAYPGKWRAIFAKIFFGAAVLILIGWNYLVIFHWEVLGDTDKSLFSKDASFKSGALILHHASDQLTLLVFYIRHLYCAWLHPDHFVMIKADVKGDREKLEAVWECEEDGQEHEHLYLPDAVLHSHAEVRGSTHATRASTLLDPTPSRRQTSPH